MNINIKRARKAVAAAGGTLLAELGAVLAAGGDPTSPGAIGAGVGLAVATGVAVYRARNRPSSDELRAQLREAMERGE